MNLILDMLPLNAITNIQVVKLSTLIMNMNLNVNMTLNMILTLNKNLGHGEVLTLGYHVMTRQSTGFTVNYHVQEFYGMHYMHFMITL